jgi:phage-related protein
MICKECGTELPENTMTCTNCGANQQVEAEQGQAPKPKKSKLKKIIAASVAGVVLLVAIVALAIVNQPKVKVMIGFYNTGKAISKQKSGLDQLLGLSEISKSAKNNAYQHTLSLDYDDESLGNMGIKMNAVTDFKNSQFKTQLYPMFKNQEVTEFVFFANKKKSVFGLPDLYDKYLYIDNLAEKMEYKEYVAYTTKSWKSIIKNMKVKKSGKKEFEIDGKKKSCRGYEIVIRKEDMKELINDYEKYYEASAEDMKNFPYQNYAELKEQLDKFSKLLDKDLTLNVYMDSKWKVISIDSKYIMSISGIPFETKFTFSMLGKKNPLGTLDGELSISVLGQGATVDFTRNQEMKGASLKDVMNFTVDTGDDAPYQLNLEGNINTETGDWNVDITGNEEDFLNIKGAIKDVKKGKSFTITLDSIKCDEYYELEDIKGSYSLAPYSGEQLTDPSEGQELANLEEMSEEEIDKMLDDIGQKASALCLSLLM